MNYVWNAVRAKQRGTQGHGEYSSASTNAVHNSHCGAAVVKATDRILTATLRQHAMDRQ